MKGMEIIEGLMNPDVFQPKTFLIPRGIIPQNFRSLGFAVSEELGNKQTNKHTNSLTDWRFYRVILVTLNLDYVGKSFGVPKSLHNKAFTCFYYYKFSICYYLYKIQNQVHSKVTGWMGYTHCTNQTISTHSPRYLLASY